MKKLILLLSVLLFSLEFVAAQDEYERSVFVSSSGDSLNYRLLEPEVMQAGEKYPLVLFPQCPESGYWAYENRPQSFIPTQMPVGKEMPSVFQAVKELLDMYLANPQVDKSRIYIMGLSMGAMGTYDMVSRFPDIFAAAVPICGTVNPTRLSAARNVAFRIFHGDADDVVPVAGSRQAYKALKAAGASVEYIEFPGCNHGSWNPAFNYPDFIKWLFTQKKK